jgi:hypothetical protein
VDCVVVAPSYGRFCSRFQTIYFRVFETIFGAERARATAEMIQLNKPRCRPGERTCEEIISISWEL